MRNNRRNFIKQLGGTAASVGISGIAFSSCAPTARATGESRKPLPEQIIEVSENGAISETKYGKIRGYRRNGIYIYKGIPYGASTAGKNRFMAPMEPVSWTGVRNALMWGNAAPAEAGLGDPFEPNFEHFDNNLHAEPFDAG